MKQLKIINWNACLGAFNKIDFIRNQILITKPNIAFIQESEIQKTMDLSLIKIEGYDVTMSENDPKSRLICYTRKEMNCQIECFRNLELIKISTNKYEIFGLYRPFKLPKECNAISYLTQMINAIKSKKSANKTTIICGDINLDYLKRNTNNYHQSKLYEIWENFVSLENLQQKIETPTWHRFINGELKESILDHFYIPENNNVLVEIEATSFSDHDIIHTLVNKAKSEGTKSQNKTHIYVRKWGKYTRENFLNELSKIDWTRTYNMSVQDHVNYFDQSINLALDKLVPEIRLKTKEKPYNWSVELIKLKHSRQNLWRKFKKTKDQTLIPVIKKLDTTFKQRLKELEKNKVRKQINVNDPKTFWSAVNTSLGKSNNQSIPTLVIHDKEVEKNVEKAEAFALHFGKNTETPRVEPETIWEPEINTRPRNFVTMDILKKAVDTLKPKRSFGHDRTPLLTIKDGFPIIKESLLKLMQKIVETKDIPSKWKVSRIIPIYKKGQKTNIENYRPISNLCSLAKVFEKVILQHIHDLEEEFTIDFSGQEQYGFKKKSSTVTAMLQIQAKITEALENNKMASLISLDLSAAFDTVDHRLLVAKLQAAGIPTNIVALIDEWLTGREAYVEVDGETSYFFDVKKGTVQGSILGPVLFAIFVRGLEDIEPVSIYADDNYLVCAADTEIELVEELGTRTTNLITWLTNNGLKVNLKKTEFIIFNNKNR